MRIAVIFSRFGPYHLARLDAAAACMQRAGGTVVGIEVASADRTYAWDAVPQAGRFEAHTLFPGNVYDDIGSRRIREATRRKLAAVEPRCVAIPGWSSTEALAALSWAVEHNVPAVLMSESARGDFSRRAVSEWVKQRIVGLCDAGLVGGSRHAAYAAELGMSPDRIFLGYDTVDNGHFTAGAAQAREAAASLRATHGLPERYFVASCRFVPKKNLAGLLTAFADYCARAGEDAWGLVICGDGDLRPALEEQRAALGLQSRVHFPGFIQYDQLPLYYGLAGAFVHVSTVEQWGLAVNEALAAGLPVVVSNACGCAPELVVDGTNGFLVEALDSTGQADRMLTLSGDAGLRRRMGSAAVQHAENWGCGRFGDGLLRAMESGTSASRSRPGIIDRMLLKLVGMR